MEFQIHHVETIDSTNTALKQLAKAGMEAGYVLVADRQTAGRGRLGRHFYSPAGSGLYVSILLRPDFPIKPAALTCMSAVAAADTIFEYGKSCRIKWVNDLYVGDKKAGGILTEGAFSNDGEFSYVIIGIGINLSLPNPLPLELHSIITSVFETPVDPLFRDEFLEKLLNHFSRYYAALPEISFWERYNALQNCCGRTVSFVRSGQTFIGTAEGIDEDFRLLVRCKESIFALERGEVTFC